MDTLDDLTKEIDAILERGAALGEGPHAKMVQEIYALQDRYVELRCPGYREVKNLYDQAERWPSYSDYTGIFYSIRRLIELNQIDFVKNLAKSLYEVCEDLEYPENFKHAEFRVSLKKMLDVIRDYVLFHHKPYTQKYEEQRHRYKYPFLAQMNEDKGTHYFAEISVGNYFLSVQCGQSSYSTPMEPLLPLDHYYTFEVLVKDRDRNVVLSDKDGQGLRRWLFDTGYWEHEHYLGVYVPTNTVHELYKLLMTL